MISTLIKNKKFKSVRLAITMVVFSSQLMTFSAIANENSFQNSEICKKAANDLQKIKENALNKIDSLEQAMKIKNINSSVDLAIDTFYLVTLFRSGLANTYTPAMNAFTVSLYSTEVLADYFIYVNMKKAKKNLQSLIAELDVSLNDNRCDNEIIPNIEKNSALASQYQNLILTQKTLISILKQFEEIPNDNSNYAIYGHAMVDAFFAQHLIRDGLTTSPINPTKLAALKNYPNYYMTNAGGIIVWGHAVSDLFIYQLTLKFLNSSNEYVNILISDLKSVSDQIKSIKKAIAYENNQTN